jgi:hypothetical protein
MYLFHTRKSFYIFFKKSFKALTYLLFQKPTLRSKRATKISTLSIITTLLNNLFLKKFDRHEITLCERG